MTWQQQISSIVTTQPFIHVVQSPKVPIKPHTKEARITINEQLNQLRKLMRDAVGMCVTTKQVAKELKITEESARTRLRWLVKHKEVEVLARNSKFESAIWRLK